MYDLSSNVNLSSCVRNAFTGLLDLVYCIRISSMVLLSLNLPRLSSRRNPSSAQLKKPESSSFVVNFCRMSGSVFGSVDKNWFGKFMMIHRLKNASVSSDCFL